MRVLLISHTCQSRSEGQPKARELAAKLDGELLVLVPERWKHYGRWRHAQPPVAADYHYAPAKAAWPWTGPGQFYLHWYPTLAKLLRTFRPDVIDVWEEPWSFVSAHVCWLRNRILPKSRIISETEQNLDKRYPPPFEWFRSYSLRHADFAVGRSQEAVRIIRSRGYDGPTEVVPNAVDHEIFHPMDREKCRQELGLQGFVVGYIGRLVERKGIMDLVDALRICPPTTNLVFVGSGEYEKKIRVRLRGCGMESRARFLPERPLEELPAIMNAIDVLALPSWTVGSWKEQFGRVIIEAQACGTPVIGSDSGAIPAVIGQGGLVFPERNAASLASRITELFNDPAGRCQLGEKGRRQVLEKYTWNRVAGQMLRIYQETERVSRKSTHGGEPAWENRY